MNDSTKETRDAEIIRAILVSDTYTEAAQLAGVSRQTIYNKLHDSLFVERLEAARAERKQRLDDAMNEAVPKAVAALVEIVESSKEDSIAALFGGGVTTKDRIEAARILLRVPDLQKRSKYSV